MEEDFYWLSLTHVYLHFAPIALTWLFIDGQKLHKITQNSMKNTSSAPILTNLVGIHPRNIYTKF